MTSINSSLPFDQSAAELNAMLVAQQQYLQSLNARPNSTPQGYVPPPALYSQPTTLSDLVFGPQSAPVQSTPLTPFDIMYGANQESEVGRPNFSAPVKNTLGAISSDPIQFLQTINNAVNPLSILNVPTEEGESYPDLPFTGTSSESLPFSALTDTEAQQALDYFVRSNPLLGGANELTKLLGYDFLPTPQENAEADSSADGFLSALASLNGEPSVAEQQANLRSNTASMFDEAIAREQSRSVPGTVLPALQGPEADFNAQLERLRAIGAPQAQSSEPAFDAFASALSNVPTPAPLSFSPEERLAYVNNRNFGGSNGLFASVQPGTPNFDFRNAEQDRTLQQFEIENRKNQNIAQAILKGDLSTIDANNNNSAAVNAFNVALAQLGFEGDRASTSFENAIATAQAEAKNVSNRASFDRDGRVNALLFKKNQADLPLSTGGRLAAEGEDSEAGTSFSSGIQRIKNAATPQEAAYATWSFTFDKNPHKALQFAQGLFGEGDEAGVEFEDSPTGHTEARERIAKGMRQFIPREDRQSIFNGTSGGIKTTPKAIALLDSYISNATRTIMQSYQPGTEDFRNLGLMTKTLAIEEVFPTNSAIADFLVNEATGG